MNGIFNYDGKFARFLQKVSDGVAPYGSELHISNSCKIRTYNKTLICKCVYHEHQKSTKDHIYHFNKYASNCMSCGSCRLCNQDAATDYRGGTGSSSTSECHNV